MPKVSVLVPVYGVEKYIERCARSLFEQTLDDIEFIFVDDCTPDRSIDILKTIIEEYRLNFAEKKYSVKIERMPTNSGQAAVRRHGLQFCTGEFIAHCDSDDWVDCNMYKRMYERAINETADVVVCDYVSTDGMSSTVRHAGCHQTTPISFIESCLLQRDSWSLCNKLFDRKVCYKELVYPEGAMGEDMTLTIQLLYNCRTLSYLPEPFYYYFKNSNSITNINTKEACVKKYKQLSSNSKIVLNFLKKTRLDAQLKDAIVSYKNNMRSVLYPILWDRKYYKIWKTMFPGLNIQVLTSRSISSYDKCKVMAALVHLYPNKKNRAL